MVLSIVPRVHDAVRHELAVGLRFGSLLHPVTDDQSPYNNAGRNTDSRKVTGGSKSGDDNEGERVKGWVTLGEAVHFLGRLLNVSGRGEGVRVGL